MPASGLIWAVWRFRRTGWVTVGLIVEDGIVVDAPPIIRRAKGGCARQAWRELARYADQLEWLPADTGLPGRPTGVAGLGDAGVG